MDERMDNNFNLAHMSASLPRIKTVHVLPKHPSIEIPKELKVKFRKLTLDEPPENVEERRKSIKTIKSSRLNSLERYSNVQEQREYKNEKIHLNLIERKLLAGTYDEKSETGHELTALKNRRDQMRVDMAAKQKEIERVRALLEDVRQETQVFLSKKGEHEEKLKEIKERSDAQQLRAEAARENRSVLENMIGIREVYLSPFRA
jgi:chromosome segregation ATPase